VSCPTCARPISAHPRSGSGLAYYCAVTGRWAPIAGAFDPTYYARPAPTRRGWLARIRRWLGGSASRLARTDGGSAAAPYLGRTGIRRRPSTFDAPRLAQEGRVR
jgi:hypothetical protein